MITNTNNDSQTTKRHKITKVVFIFFAVCFFKSSFFFTGPINGVVLDAKTNKPIPNIEIQEKIFVSSISFNGNGRSFEKITHTDKNGKFSFSQPVSIKFPLLSWVDDRQLSVNQGGGLNTYPYYHEGAYSDVKVAASGYEGFDYIISWLPFANYKFKLIPLNNKMNLNYCGSLNDNDKLRCLYHVAKKDSQDEQAVAVALLKNFGNESPRSFLEKFSRSSTEYSNFLFSKYKNKYFRCCEKNYKYNSICSYEERCDAVMASEKNDLSLCSSTINNNLNEEYKNKYINECQFFVAIDKSNISYCELIKKTPSKISLALSQACLNILVHLGKSTVIGN